MTAPDLVIELATGKQLEPGGLYALEVPGYLGQSGFERIRQALEPFEKSYGVKFVIFDAGMKVSEIRPAGVEEIADAVVRKLKESSRAFGVLSA